MEHLFADYEVSTLVKEKGFDKPCLAFYLDEEYSNSELYFDYQKVAITVCFDKGVAIQLNYVNAPLWDQLIEWLAEKHNIDISTPPFYDMDGRLYSPIIYLNANGSLQSDIENTIMFNEVDTKQEARRTAILHALTLIKL